MAFRIDKQTLSDLGLFSQNEKTPSLFGFYNRTATIGGQEQLYKIIRSPFSDIGFLENRKAEIRFFHNLNDTLKLNRRQLDYIEYYLKSRRVPLKNNFIDAVRNSLANKLKSDNDYYNIGEGIIHLSSLLKDLKEFLQNIQDNSPPESLLMNFEYALNFINSGAISDFIINIPDNSRKLKPKQINLLDNYYRDKKSIEIRTVLDTVYEIDVLQSLSNLLKEELFCLPEYSKGENLIFEAVDCIHPLLDNPKPNSFRLDKNQSLCFITGPNMSGKSTFLKTIGILTYFAHLGIPIPARRLKITVLNGLFTTINLSDSLSQGFSHFFAEVNRVKDMALQIQDNSRIVVILDELFRGTNVKDAYDGTLMVVDSLSKIRGAFFFISTHILEVAEDLGRSKNIDFKCFESILNLDKPIYDYKLKEGVTTERVGMQIIRNERIEDILSDIIKKQN
ncbi:MAG: hypothetical protein E4G95_00155 [Bacteroidia bacterium]|nr:MAG: hypothetical protein E4G95_00155 [Bacteroidia bacterium]